MFQELSSVRWAPLACWGMLDGVQAWAETCPPLVFLLEWHNLLGSWPAAWQRHTGRLLIPALTGMTSGCSHPAAAAQLHSVLLPQLQQPSKLGGMACTYRLAVFQLIRYNPACR